jgi:hypothetical protein
MRKLVFIAVTLLVLGFSSLARGDIVVFDDKADFLSATGASEAADFHDTTSGNKGLYFSVGDLTFTSASGREFWVLDWSARLDYEELAISALEHMDVDIDLGYEVFSFGFEFVEPENDPGINAPFVDSTFTVSLLSGATNVDSFMFNVPNDQVAFVGVWSYPDQGFDKVQIRETTGGIENEFFGEFYVGTQPVPVPAAVLLGMLGLSVAGIKLRKFA